MQETLQDFATSCDLCYCCVRQEQQGIKLDMSSFLLTCNQGWLKFCDCRSSKNDINVSFLAFWLMPFKFGVDIFTGFEMAGFDNWTPSLLPKMGNLYRTLYCFRDLRGKIESVPLYITDSHCAFSSNLFHGQIPQKAIHKLSDTENKKCSP